MSDIIEEAEAALADAESSWRQGWGPDDELLARLVPDLVAALKAARAEAEKWEAAFKAMAAK